MTVSVADKRKMALLELSPEGLMVNFMSTMQRMTVRNTIIFSDEGEFYIDKILELAERIRTMPKTYEQDGNPNPTAYLRYFRGSATAWITEKDMGTGDANDTEQIQAYGYVTLFGGGFNEAEAGYVSIKELIEAQMELDFHFEPTVKKDLEKGSK